MDVPSQDLVVDTRDLVRTYGAQRALDGLTLSVRRGESLGLLGPNGAGKTTTIKILSTLLAPTSGSVRVLGRDPAVDAPAIRARIGVVPQEIALYDGLTGAENLAFFGRVSGLEERRVDERVAWALEQAGLADRAKDRVGTYSGGMKRRLNIVAALLHEPELVFLDEPTVGIDPQSRNHVYGMVETLRRSGVAIVYTTHQLGEVDRLCDRIVILDSGRAIAEGTLAELQRRVAGRERSWLKVDAGERANEARAWLEQRGIEFVVHQDLPGLEEVFLALTGRALRDEA
jgi:ABC-2 type transport system ATP-binding protein